MHEYISIYIYIFMYRCIYVLWSRAAYMYIYMYDRLIDVYINRHIFMQIGVYMYLGLGLHNNTS